MEVHFVTVKICIVGSGDTGEEEGGRKEDRREKEREKEGRGKGKSREGVNVAKRGCRTQQLAWNYLHLPEVESEGGPRQDLHTMAHH